MFYLGQPKGKAHPMAFVTFVECKSTAGKQKPDQVGFEKMITQLHCRYVIVRDVGELIKVLEEE